MTVRVDGMIDDLMARATREEEIFFYTYEDCDHQMVGYQGVVT
jgi:hypothetical protein